MSHAPRAPLAARFPAHVTAKLREHLPALRRKDAYAALRAAFAGGCDRNGFRLIHYAVRNDHLHFVVEATGRSAPWFDGFRERLVVRNLPAERPVTDARTWLLTIGWRRHGLLSLLERPA